MRPSTKILRTSNVSRAQRRAFWLTTAAIIAISYPGRGAPRPQRHDTTAGPCGTFGNPNTFIAIDRIVFALPYTPTIGGETTVPSSFAKANHLDQPANAQDVPLPRPPDGHAPEGCLKHPAERSSYTLDGHALAAFLQRRADRANLDQQLANDTATISRVPENITDWLSVFSGPMTLSRGPYCDDRDKRAIQNLSPFLKCFYHAPNTGEWFGQGRTDEFQPAYALKGPIWFSCKAGFCDANDTFIRGVDLEVHFYVPPNAKPIPAMTDLMRDLENTLRAAEIESYPWPPD